MGRILKEQILTDFPIQADHIVKIKESKIQDKCLDLSR